MVLLEVSVSEKSSGILPPERQSTSEKVIEGKGLTALHQPSNSLEGLRRAVDRQDRKVPSRQVGYLDQDHTQNLPADEVLDLAIAGPPTSVRGSDQAHDEGRG